MNLALDLHTSKQLVGNHPATLTPAQLGAVLDAATVLDSYIALAREEAEKRIASGKDVEGWELVATPGRRSIVDPVRAARQLAPLLEIKKIMECATLGLGKIQEAIAEAEKVTPAKAKEIMADYLKSNIVKSAGGQVLQAKPKQIEVKAIEEFKLEESL